MRQRENEGKILCFPVSYRSKQGKNICIFADCPKKAAITLGKCFPKDPLKTHVDIVTVSRYNIVKAGEQNGYKSYD